MATVTREPSKGESEARKYLDVMGRSPDVLALRFRRDVAQKTAPLLASMVRQLADAGVEPERGLPLIIQKAKDLNIVARDLTPAIQTLQQRYLKDTGGFMTASQLVELGMMLNACGLQINATDVQIERAMDRAYAHVVSVSQAFPTSKIERTAAAEAAHQAEQTRPQQTQIAAEAQQDADISRDDHGPSLGGGRS